MQIGVSFRRRAWKVSSFDRRKPAEKSTQPAVVDDECKWHNERGGSESDNNHARDGRAEDEAAQ